VPKEASVTLQDLNLQVLSTSAVVTNANADVNSASLIIQVMCYSESNSSTSDQTAGRHLFLTHTLDENARVVRVADVDVDGLNELVVGTFESNGVAKVKILKYNKDSNNYVETWGYSISNNPEERTI